MRGQTNASNVGGTVGDDAHPIKIVDNVPTPVTNELQTKLTTSEISVGNNCYMARYGQIIMINMVGYYASTAGIRTILTDLPRCISQATTHANDGNGSYNGEMWITTGATFVNYRPLIANSQSYATLIYFTDQ